MLLLQLGVAILVAVFSSSPNACEGWQLPPTTTFRTTTVPPRRPWLVLSGGTMTHPTMATTQLFSSTATAASYHHHMGNTNSSMADSASPYSQQQQQQLSSMPSTAASASASRQTITKTTTMLTPITTSSSSSSSSSTLSPPSASSLSSTTTEAAPETTLTTSTTTTTTTAAAPRTMVWTNIASTAELLEMMQPNQETSASLPSPSFLVIKYHASYCKICQRASIPYRQMAATEYDPTVVQFARFEGGSPTMIHPDDLRLLGVTCFPFIQIYRVADGACVASFSATVGHLFRRRVRDAIDVCLSRNDMEWDTFNRACAADMAQNWQARQALQNKYAVSPSVAVAATASSNE